MGHSRVPKDPKGPFPGWRGEAGGTAREAAQPKRFVAHRRRELDWPASFGPDRALRVPLHQHADEHGWPGVGRGPTPAFQARTVVCGYGFAVAQRCASPGHVNIFRAAPAKAPAPGPLPALNRAPLPFPPPSFPHWRLAPLLRASLGLLRADSGAQGLQAPLPHPLQVASLALPPIVSFHPHSRHFQFPGSSKVPTPSPSPPNDSTLNDSTENNTAKETIANHQRDPSPPPTPPPCGDDNGHGSPLNNSPSSSVRRRNRSSSRPLSMVQTYKPRIMDVTEETLPELQPIFSFLNSHSNKLYHEGYFLKLDDQNSQGKPNPDRTWVECFAQLVGTVLSLWDAAELDAAGEDGKVMPKFLNLTDASIKMIESLPTRSSDEQPLQNILSISTAGRNRYLLHFNSHESLVQWTAAVRLAIYEYNCLQEAYTGALIAGKGKTLNNINVIMERARFKTEEWVLVRFGAGVPWRRCWGVINPPNEKEYAKLEKELKKRSPYDRSTVPVVKGDIKFYDQKIEGKKQKKVQPIATITDAYSAYAIYPQSKNLIDPSTLLKIEGNITIHSEPPSSSEGFVFIMPEIRPMVSGFEMLLRFLFPTWDTFGLYGRPGKIVASILDARSLMFAMPKHRRYGYLEPVDVINLIADHSSGTWNEQEWRRRMKEATGSRMNAIEDGSRRPPSHSRSDSRNSNQVSIGDSGSRPQVGFADDQRDRSGSLNNGAPQDLGAMRSLNTPEPVSRPPAEFGQQKSLGQRASKAYHSPELRRANSRLSRSTLAHLVKAGGMDPNQQPIESLPEGRGMEDGAIAGPSAKAKADHQAAYPHLSISPKGRNLPWACPSAHRVRTERGPTSHAHKTMGADPPTLQEGQLEVRWAGLSGVRWAARLAVLWGVLRVVRWGDLRGRPALLLTASPAQDLRRRLTTEGSRQTCAHLRAARRNLDTMGEDAEALPPGQVMAHLGPPGPTSGWLSQTGLPVWIAPWMTLSIRTLLIRRLPAIHAGDRLLAVDLRDPVLVLVPALSGVLRHRISTEVVTEARTATRIRMAAVMTMAQADRDPVCSRQWGAVMARDRSATTIFQT
ncbi:hypothetical protein ACRE_088810 [Hapsidospora chrysogenum ATCC 11550]|uniref:PH domain-containing protein n=1 Tax=Hapsidospora chrysogenum (strain ATCC 11550 / CBS 779.69 / DSM 880 / IAM 14645 / JCM 23072 / IMI 49137) TaxID=857340 RepID=A0A086STM1_HAPC1|nr:hypothetical protein ACRE_088810 [Hapsidospora chrysogenum ATCC 11550]